MGDDFFLRGCTVTHNIPELVDMSIVGSVLSICTEPFEGATLAKVIARVYAHAIPQSQREAMENIGGIPIGTVNGTVLKFARK